MFRISSHRTYSDKDTQGVPEKTSFREGDNLLLQGVRFAVVREVGQGGFATVYLIRDDAGRPFALKVLDLWRMRPDEYAGIAERFEQGFKAGQIDSPYLVRSIQHGRLLGNPYIRMAYCPNGSLASRKSEFQDIRRFQGIAMGILQALRDLHDHGVIHRDIKPENILFGADDTPMLTDFDISGHLKKRRTSRNWRGAVKEIWGTAVYAPPEQLDHNEAFAFLKPAMDMFAFGVTAYEVLSGGHYPYGNFEEFAADPTGFYRKVRQGQLTPITFYRRDLPHHWVDIIHSCLRPDPEKRLQHPDEALRMLGNTVTRSPRNHDTQFNEWVIRVMNGEEIGREYNITRLARNAGTGVVRLGSSHGGERENHIVIREERSRYISRRHATLEWIGSQWSIRDGQWDGQGGWHRSTNGTLVNGQPVDSLRGLPLHHEDIVTVGETTLKFLHI